MKKIVVLGAGAWGTAIALCLQKSCDAKIILWARSESRKQELESTRVNKYLPNIVLPDNLFLSSDLSETNNADIVFMVTPSIAVEEILKNISIRNKIVLCSKGLDKNGNRLSMHAKSLGFEYTVLSGPNHAEEIALGLPAASVVAGSFAQDVQKVLMSDNFRIYTSQDVVGVELCGVLKNVIAIAAGIVDGLKLGDNAKAAILTRGIAEMLKYLKNFSIKEETIYGLSGLGDLIATANSLHSRNRAAGEALALGKNLEQSGKVVEGLRTAKLLNLWAKENNKDLPIIRAVAEVAEFNWSPEFAVNYLMQRSAKPEYI